MATLWGTEGLMRKARQATGQQRCRETLTSRQTGCDGVLSVPCLELPDISTSRSRRWGWGFTEVRTQMEQQRQVTSQVTSLLLPHPLSPWKSSIRASSPTPAPSNAGSQSARLEVPEQAQLLSPHEFPQSLPRLHPSPISAVWGPL